MPKGTRPSSTANKTYYKNDEVTGADGKTKMVPPSQTRNFVGDDGAAEVAKAKTTDAPVSSATDRQTPQQKKAAAKAARDKFDAELVDKVKNATAQRGGALVRSNYGS